MTALVLPILRMLDEMPDNVLLQLLNKLQPALLEAAAAVVVVKRVVVIVVAVREKILLGLEKCLMMI
jgi:hypothetical protein